MLAEKDNTIEKLKLQLISKSKKVLPKCIREVRVTSRIRCTTAIATAGKVYNNVIKVLDYILSNLPGIPRFDEPLCEMIAVDCIRAGQFGSITLVKIKTINVIVAAKVSQCIMSSK